MLKKDKSGIQGVSFICTETLEFCFTLGVGPPRVEAEGWGLEAALPLGS